MAGAQQEWVGLGALVGLGGSVAVLVVALGLLLAAPSPVWAGAGAEAGWCCGEAGPGHIGPCCPCWHPQNDKICRDRWQEAGTERAQTQQGPTPHSPHRRKGQKCWHVAAFPTKPLITKHCSYTSIMVVFPFLTLQPCGVNF